MHAASDSDRMASKKVPITPPPRGPALVRPAVGALLLSLSGAACGDDDGTGTDGATTEQPPMPNPTDTAPMVLPTTTNDDSTQPPMPNPTDTEGTSSGGEESTTGADGTGTGTGTSTGDTGSGSETAIPPMPPPTTGE